MKQVSDSTKILLVTPDKVNLDIIASTLVLGEALRRSGKEIDILTHVKNYEDSFAQSFSKGDLNIYKKINSNKFSFKFAKGKEVDAVNIVEDSESFKVEVVTKSSSLSNSNINLSREPEMYDLIVLIGCSAFDSSKEFSNSYGGLIAKAPTLLLGYTKFDVRVDDFYTQKASSNSEVVFNLLEELSIKPDEILATKLLAGIVSNTHNLKINTNKKTLSVVQRLTNEYNANFSWANSVANKSLTPEQFEWQKLVFENTKRIENFAYSIVDSSNVDSSMLGSLNNEDKVPIHKIEGIDVALVLTKLNKTVHGFLYLNSSKISGLSLTNEYPRVGDNKFVYFWTKENPQRIIRDFESKIGISTPVIQTVEKETIKNEIKAILETEVIETKEDVADSVEKLDPNKETIPNTDNTTEELPQINMNRLSDIEILTSAEDDIENKILETDSPNETDKPSVEPVVKEEGEKPQNYDPLPQAF